MPPQLALFSCIILIFLLLRQDVKIRPPTPVAIWLPIAWLLIIGSRPLSAWLELGNAGFSEGMASDESPLDRNFFILLIGAAWWVLKRRHLQWGTLAASNRAFFLLYIFFGISVLWSDEPFVALKRLVKDFGNVLMVLIILTDKNPTEAARAVILRCAYILIPLSVLFAKYYPQFGTAFSSFTGGVHFFGVALGKNMLGATVLVLVLFIVWELLTQIRGRNRSLVKPEVLAPGLMLLMALYILMLAHSATATACAAFGAAGLVALSSAALRNRLDKVFHYGLLGAIAILALSLVVDPAAEIAQLLGRDPTLTGRDQIWRLVLEQNSDPLIGSGFNSFWLGNRSEILSKNEHYCFLLNQAHNGYIEVYLNGGLIGVGLLLGVLGVGGKKIRRQLPRAPDWTGVRLVIWVICILYNWSEAAFFRLSPIWFVLVLSLLELPIPFNPNKEQPVSTSLP